MELDLISQYVLSIAPAASAILGCVGAAAVCIHRVKKVCKDSERNIREINEKASKGRSNAEILKENEDLRRDVALLKENNRILTQKLKGVRILEEEE